MADLRCGAEADSRCVLVSATSTRVQSACQHSDHTAAWVGVCHGAATNGWTKLVADPRCEVEAESRCVLVSSPALRCRAECLHSDQTLAGVCFFHGAVQKLRLMEQGYGRSTVRGGGGEVKVHARICRRHLDGECLPSRPGTCRWLPLQRRRHEAPTDGARLRLLHMARQWHTQGACTSLPLTLGWRVLGAAARHLQVFAFA